MLTIAAIQAALPAASTRSVEKFADPLIKACAEFGINTPLRIAAFLAQVAHESGNFRYVAENLNYSEQGLRAVFGRYFADGEAASFARRPEAIANRVYSNRLGNGDEASGDGWRYRGRGLIQITGRSNYGACGRGLGLDLIAHPDLLEQPTDAARSAAWFWRERDLNRLADDGDLETITRRINGGLNGFADRKNHYAHALQALGAETTEV